jgi:hypothetical protein
VRSIRKNALEDVTTLEEGWQFQKSWEHGPFYVIGRLWEDLGIRKIIEEAAREGERSVPFGRAVFLMVANRSLAPRSKLGCYERWMTVLGSSIPMIMNFLPKTWRWPTSSWSEWKRRGRQ